MRAPLSGQASTTLSAVYRQVEKKRKLFPSCGSVAIMAISRTISYLVVNSIFGLIVLALAKFLGLPVPINWITVLICALAGIPGALLVILLYWLGIVIPIIISLI
jgi:hypothetical protein